MKAGQGHSDIVVHANRHTHRCADKIHNGITIDNDLEIGIE